MKYFFTKLAVSFVLLFFVQATMAQTAIITGKVTDAAGSALVGVNVYISSDITLGTTSGTEGTFRLKVPKAKGKKLAFSMIGFTKKIVKLTGTDQHLKIKMVSDLMNLNEVVVTGTGSIATKKEIGASISMLNKKSLGNLNNVTSVGSALQGKIAGAYVTQNSGNPSGGISIRLRGASTLIGSSDPLYIVDGVIVNNQSTQLINLGGYSQNRLVDIDPADIDHIVVLKGAAAAAIYGSRASNGVVLIYTKHGKTGAPNITVSTSVNINQLRKEFPYNSAQLKWNSSGVAVPAKRYNYQSYIFHQAYGTHNSVSVSGGTKKTKYFISASQLYNGGIERGTDFSRKDFNVRINQVLSKWATISAGSFTSYNFSHDMPNGKNYGPLVSLLFADNTINPAPDKYGNYPYIGWMANPYEAIDRIKATTTNYRTINNIQVHLTPLKGLRVNYVLGYDHSYSVGLLFIPKGFNTQVNGRSQKNTLNTSMVNSNLNISYKINLNEFISLTTGVGNSYQFESNAIFGVTNDKVSAIDNVIITDPASATSGSDYRTKASYWGNYIQESFSFKNKIFLTAAGRVDGASTFGANQRNQLYGKFSGSYSISEEKYWKNIFGKTFDYFRIRGAWGQSGNLTALQPFQIYTNYYTLNYMGNIGFTPSASLGNSNLRPEREDEHEFGFDFSMFKNRFGGEFTWYHQNITDLLVNRPLSPSTGYSSQYANIGTMKNTGIEILLRGIPIQKSNFSWEVTGTYSRNRNITPYIEGVNIGLGMFGTSVAMSGQPLGVFYGTYYATKPDGQLLLTADGFVQKALGHYKYVKNAYGQSIPVPVQDYNSSGQPTGSVLRKVIGNPNPKFVASLINVLNYKNFRLRVQLDMVYGNQVMNWNQRMGYLFPGGAPQGLELEGKIPKGSSRPKFFIYQSFIDNGSYVKLRNVNLSYDLHIKKKKSFLKSIRFSLDGSNLLSFDHYPGPDPEVNTDSQSNGVRGQDMANVPIPRVYRFGMSFRFK